MARAKGVVGTLVATQEPAEATFLAQGAEAVEAAGEEFVGIGLMAGVPYHGVLRQLERGVECDGQFNRAQVRAEVASGAADVRKDRGADLVRQRQQLLVVQVVDLLGRRQAGKDGERRVHRAPSLGYGITCR